MNIINPYWYSIIPVFPTNYGYLYNHYAFSEANFAPTGWHVPTGTELENLKSYFGSSTTAGGHAKEVGLEHWTPNVGATDTYGFSLYGGGSRDTAGVFNVLKGFGYLWGNTGATSYQMAASANNAYMTAGPLAGAPANRKNGFSVRLVKDSTTLTNGQTGTTTDENGNVYPTICVNSQEWLAQNWRCSKLNNGTDLTYVSGNTEWAALLTEGYCAYDNNLNYVPVTPPTPFTGIIFADTIATNNAGYDVWGDGTYLYVATYNNGLMSISYDSDGNLTSVDSETTISNLLSVWGDGTYIYASSLNAGIASYSVDGSGNLTHISTVSTVTQGWGIWGDGTYIYMAGGNSGLHSYSVDGSGNLTYIDSDDQGGAYYDVVGDGSYLYVACSNFGIRTYTQSSGILTYQEINTENTDIRVLDIGGDYLYATDVSNNRTLVYSKSSGTLTRTYDELFSGNITQPLGVLKLGDYILFAGAYTNSGDVYLYEDNNNGTLTYKDLYVSPSTKDYRRMFGDNNLVFVAYYNGTLESFKLI